MVSATVVLVALIIAGAVLVVVLYYSLISSLDDAASARVADIVANLEFEPAEELDDTMLATDQRVVAVQVLDPAGGVTQRSAGAPSTPIVSIDHFGPGSRVLRDDAAPGDDVRIAGQVISTPDRPVAVLVGSGSEAVEETVFTVMALWGAAAPVVVAVSGVASYVLVRRSLQSVDAIRSRVADISTSDLSERVPVPPRRDEISALAVTMNEMLARIEAGHTAQRRFVGDASHELRSPLATIISALDVVHAHPNLLTQQLASETLMPEARRMQSLVEDLLLLARADERGLPLRREVIDLDDVARDEVSRLSLVSPISVHSQISPIKATADAARLSRVIRNLLDNAVRRGGPERPVVLKVGDIELDPARRRVTRSGTEVKLTPREYGVLEFLMRHSGTVVTKGEVVRSVWDTNYDGDDNIVEVYIGYLRRKVDLPFAGNSIETVRGFGYRIIDNQGTPDDETSPHGVGRSPVSKS